MKRFTKIFACAIAILCFSIAFTCSVSARPAAQEAPVIEKDTTVDTTFFGNLRDDSKGCGIYTVIIFIIDILSLGIGIAAVAGIIISGIYYLTAKGNEEQLTKSKRRIYEIVIGLAAYAVLYAALNFLLPGGNFNTNSQCATSSSSSSKFGKKDAWTNHQQSSSSKKSGDSGASSAIVGGGSNPNLTTSEDGTISGTKEYTKTIASSPFGLSLKAPKNVAFKSSNKKVAVVNTQGVVYPNDVGEAIITASVGSSTFKIKVTINPRTSKPTIGQALTSHASQANQVKTGKWYKNNKYANWDHVFRFKDPVKAEIAADAMIAICNNNNIGYNNSNNKINTLTKALPGVNYNPSKINKKVYTSCDRAALATVLVAGYHRNENGWGTGSSKYGGGGAPGVVKKLTKDSEHFYSFTDSSYTKNWKKLRRGDIIVDHIGGNGYRHVIMVVK